MQNIQMPMKLHPPQKIESTIDTRAVVIKLNMTPTPQEGPLCGCSGNLFIHLVLLLRCEGHKGPWVSLHMPTRMWSSMYVISLPYSQPGGNSRWVFITSQSAGTRAPQGGDMWAWRRAFKGCSASLCAPPPCYCDLQCLKQARHFIPHLGLSCEPVSRRKVCVFGFLKCIYWLFC